MPLQWIVSSLRCLNILHIYSFFPFPFEPLLPRVQLKEFNLSVQVSNELGVGWSI